MALGWKKGYIRYRGFFLDVYRVYKNRPDLKMFLEILLSLTTISFFALFALRPTALTITELLQEIKAKEETIDKMDQKIRNLDAAETLYDSEPRLALLDAALPDIPSPEAFARQLEGLAARSGASVNSLVMDNVLLVGSREIQVVSTDVTPLPEGSGEIVFSLNVLGEFESLSRFLTDLERLQRPIKVDYAIINVAQLEQGRVLTLSVTGRIPYFKKQ